MKTRKSFGEFVLNVWAAIVRVLFPRYCVKHLTLRNRNNAVYYLLGKEKELKLIDKLDFSGEQIAARLWSHGTKVELLRCGYTALINEVKMADEFLAVVSTGRSDDISSAMRVYTPSREIMLTLVSMMSKEEKLRGIVQRVPSAFDVLKPWEVLGIKEKEAPLSNREQWKVALALAEAKPAWAPLFLIELRKIIPGVLDAEGHRLMDKFFDIAFAAKEDVSEMMPYFCVFQKEKYIKVRDCYMKYKSFARCFRMMFPQLLKDLRKNAYCSVYDIRLEGELTAEQDAYAWLKIGYLCMDDPGIFDCFVENLRKVKANVHPELYNQLFKRMIDKAPMYGELVQLYHLADNVLETKIPAKLVAGMEEKQLGATLKFAFPFKGWDEKLALRGILAMAEKKEFPVTRLGELSEKLRIAAVTAMEEQAQIAAIRGENAVDLVAKTHLLPKAEFEFLQQRLYHAEKCVYVERYQLAESSFHSLVYTFDVERYKRVELISRYAAKWGLTEEQYCMVMQSDLASSAPFLKQYVR